LLASGFKIVDESQWNLLNDALDPSQTVSNRLRASEILAKARLDSKQLLSLCRVIERASPFEVDRLLDCFSTNQDDAVGLELTKALAKSKALGSLKMDVIRDKTKRYGANTQASLKSLEEKVKENNSKNLEKMETLLALIPTSDIRRGQLVFQSVKGACYSCHAIGYLGGKIGPDLTRIGQIRTERDLLESILFPSASFVRSYEPTKVITASGKIFQGLLKVDDPREIVLTTGPDQTVKISKEDIESMEPGTVSVMPAGLDQQFTPQELADLVAFLKACK
jgi:putative heme-binding domain-containing protein